MQLLELYIHIPKTRSMGVKENGFTSIIIQSFVVPALSIEIIKIAGLRGLRVSLRLSFKHLNNISVEIQ